LMIFERSRTFWRRAVSTWTAPLLVSLTPNLPRHFTPALCKVIEVGITAEHIHRLLVSKLKKSPIRILVRGENTIRLAGQQSALISTTPVGKKEVLVCIHLDEDLPKEAVNQFLHYIAENKIHDRTSVRLLEAHQTNSTNILVILPLNVAEILSPYLDVFFLFLL
jgi:hypothetical protein